MNLSGDRMITAAMVEEGAVDSVIEARRTHADELKVLANGAMALSFMSKR